ncbi:MAG: CehA/McbA family metallohydrolase [Planctomycetaceae bacterium]|nr:CehA/McbA family metallohydrolase [Planctomycetaceae bacterium]
MMPRFRSLSGWLILLAVVLQTEQATADEATVLQQLERSLSEYTTAETWAARCEELRREFLEGAGLWPLPARPPVKAIRHRYREYKGYSVENVALETLPGFYCTGNLYRPLGRKELEPAILCPHGHFQPLGRFREDQQIRCAHLARMGATVFSYSMVGWQDSQQTTHDDPLVLALQTWNSLRAVDFVSGLERIDPTRIGVTGASGGGTQSFFLALVDDRIKASAPLVIVYPWTAPDGCKCEGGLPVMQAAKTNAIELAAATSPRPQLLISVGNDPTEKFPEVGFPFIKRMYEIAGAGNFVRNVHFAEEGHDFGPSKRREVYAFFAEHLGLQPDPFDAGASTQPRVPDEDLSRIVIESPEQMEAINNALPLPAGSLQGSDAIAAVFERYLDELREIESARDSPARLADAPLAEYAFKDFQAGADDEALLFTPAGFPQVGEPRAASGAHAGTLNIVIRDSATNEPTPCRVNVVGPDGHYYEPAAHELKPFSLTGVWPKSGWGNRPGKAPVRYFGRYFYTTGDATVEVPAGTVRIEVWKGLEYRPATLTTHVAAGSTQSVELILKQAAPISESGYWSGDPHIHIARRDEADEQRIFDLLSAEGIQFGTILAYNEPAGPYAGFMEQMESPQFRGLGIPSAVSRGNSSILSGQEYRSSTYGHINFFGIDQLVLDGSNHNANDWPPFGLVAKAVREEGGVAFYAHGGYAQAIYADVVQDNLDGVELLQFGVYRGIGLVDWYHMLNAGFRVPANGACDYPACRKLGDCLTYVYSDERPDMNGWLRGMANGQSFITTGPMLLLEVDGHRPGEQIDIPIDRDQQGSAATRQGSGPPEQADHTGTTPHRVTARIRVRSEVAPVTHVQLIANGRIVKELQLPRSQGQGNGIELEQAIELDRSTWIAARAFSLSSTGAPDAESHTNPVYVIVDDKAPYERESLDVLVRAIDGQIALHKKRDFAERARVIAYFEQSRDILMKIRERGGAPAAGHPSQVAHRLPTLDDPGLRQHDDAQLQVFLQPVPPKSIGEALASFETVEGFEMQLVASEPLVVDPIAAAFDEHGNLYVCEMRDYPYKPQEGSEPIGTLRLLRDTDGDGVFDKSHVFADKLLWAGGVAPWQGGVFVAAPPDIWYMKDTDGDHRADVREKVYTGFGTGNQQAMLNNLTWGLDHKIYGATAGNGGLISTVSGPAVGAEPVSVSGHDFRFDPVTGQFEAITGTIQFGNTFDDWGNRFVCSESRPLLHAVLPEHYLARNPYLPVPSAMHNVAGGAVPIFRISPLERWRMIRSSRRVAAGARSPDAAGASHHVIDAAAGVTVYRGGAYPAEFYGQVFVGDAQNNLIHRRKLVPDGATFSSERVDEGTEFVRSSDNWFRPVNFVNAPDGTLHVLDMSREILESIHIPDDVVGHLDLTSGRTHGRIYRIAPRGFVYPGPPTIARASTAELVAALESPHGWQRDTAHRLLYERQDDRAVVPLRTLLASHAPAQARLHALRSLGGLQSLSDNDLITALDDGQARLQEHAMALAESRLDHSPVLLDRVIAHCDQQDIRLRIQAAFSLGESHNPRAAAALADLARAANADPWLRIAVLSSAGGQPAELFATLLQDARDAEVLEQLAAIVGSRKQVDERVTIIEALAVSEVVQAQPDLGTRLLLALGRSLRHGGASLQTDLPMSDAARAFVVERIHNARETAQDASIDVEQRRRTIALLGCAEYGVSSETLVNLLTIEQPEVVQLAAVEALSSYAEADVAGLLLAGWRQQSPGIRQEVVDGLLSQPQWTLPFLQAAKRGDASVALVDANRRALLVKHPDAEIRTLAAELFDDSMTSGRAEVVASYASALDLDGDVVRGEAVFRRDCLVCHRLQGAGYAIGPDLASSPSREAAALLTHVLDPNRYVLPNYESYVVIDTVGRIYTGLIAAQTATSITLKREENKTDTILRTNIDELTSTGKSLMPEGLEKKISVEEMADPIAFLQATQAPGDTASLPIGTLPGLIEPNRSGGK